MSERSEALKKAQNKYKKEKMTSVLIRLHKENDKDIIDRLEKIGNKQGYIKQLIRDDLTLCEIECLEDDLLNALKNLMNNKSYDEANTLILQLIDLNKKRQQIQAAKTKKTL